MDNRSMEQNVKLDFHSVGRPHPSCVVGGDIGFWEKTPAGLFGFLIDVAGHGEQAYLVAEMLERFVRRQPKENLVEVVKSIHKKLEGTVGGVGAVVHVDHAGSCEVIAIGDVTIRVIGADGKFLVSMDGLLGHALPSIYPERFTFENGDILILHTDGLVRHTQPDDFADALNLNARGITELFLDRFSKDSDDALCMAVRIVQ